MRIESICRAAKVVKHYWDPISIHWFREFKDDTPIRSTSAKSRAVQISKAVKRHPRKGRTSVRTIEAVQHLLLPLTAGVLQLKNGAIVAIHSTEHGCAV
jgi:hypothetical protein